MRHGQTLRCLMLFSAFGLIPACSTPREDGQLLGGGLGSDRQALQLDPNYQPDNLLVQATPAHDYTLFEADPVRPVAVLPDSGLVAVANTADDYLDILAPTARGVRSCGAIKVGMRPVAVAVVHASRTDAELWVVNHLSDSISVVHVDPSSCRGEVVDTLFTGDEPRDIVVAKTRHGEERVFVTSAHRGQHHPSPAARSGVDLVNPAQAKQSKGLADVLVFDPEDPGAPPAVVNLFTDTPRALAVGDGVVYAAGFRTGNRTTAVHSQRALQKGLDRLRGLLATDSSGQFIEQNGELLLSDTASGTARMTGGMPAVRGSGRCLPDPRPDREDEFTQQVCVQVDQSQRVQRVVLQQSGQVTPECQCTSGDGALQPTTAVIVKFFDQKAACGDAFTSFPDGTHGCWLDADPAGNRTPAVHTSEQAPPMAWNEDVALSLPDQDVFAIRVEDLRVQRAFSGVGTVLFNMAVQPGTGQLFVTNTEAKNLNHFEGSGLTGSSTVLGHLHESRITVIDPRSGRVEPVHLNTHIDYSQCCERVPGENENSLAFPNGGVFSPDGSKFFFAALGSDEVGIVASRVVGPGFDNLGARRHHELSDIVLGPSIDQPSGPVGLELDAGRRRLYVKTHISNELIVIDTQSERIIDREALHTPEPDSIRAGRRVFYNTRLTSAHGDSACASCHTFGDFDGLSWDLGNPDSATVTNPGPFALPVEVGDFIPPTLTPNFRSNKGPMNTQTLRGIANHGSTHWRGDRTRNFQNEPGHQPNFGSLDENNSFGEFDVAITGLNGNDKSLDPAVFQSFTDFALQLTLPPNPIRALDDSLDMRQARARAQFFGCASLTDEQFEARQCTALDGTLVDIDPETQNCLCTKNGIVTALRQLPEVIGLGQRLQTLLGDPSVRDAFVAAASDSTGLSAAELESLAGFVSTLDASIDALLAAQLTVGAKGLLAAPAAHALQAFADAALALEKLPRGVAGASRDSGLGVLVSATTPEAPLDSLSDLTGALEEASSVLATDQLVLADEAARGSGQFHDVLTGCDPSQPEPVCRLRVTDTFATCNGCHTLDPAGNAKFDVYRPGFFGTNGRYTFENESQVFKVPHLRNLYQKVGMFGMPQVAFFFQESVLGPGRGGFFSPENQYQGPQVRGFGFLHDGSTDTVQRFHGAAVFLARPPATLSSNDPGNPTGFDPVFPESATRAACVAKFRAASPDSLGALDPSLLAALQLCAASSPVPDACFLDPASSTCTAALGQIGLALGQPGFAETFSAQILPACFQFGSMLESGSPDGSCAPAGLRDRFDMEAFMLAFDSNLKPMVGQQVTLRGSTSHTPFLRSLLRSASLGQCDLALRQRNVGYLVTHPNPGQPDQTGVAPEHGRATTLGALQRSAEPITLTCYPPSDDHAEARRSAFQ